MGATLLVTATEVAATLGPRPRVDDLVVVAVALLGAAVCGWLTLVGVAAALAPRRWRPAIAAASPAVWRRVITVALGTAVATGVALPASAAGWVVDTPQVEPSSAGWLAHTSAENTEAPQPPRASPPAAPVTTPTDDTPTAATAPDNPAQATHTVSRGESLWTITAAMLGTRDAATIAAAWPALYEANRDALGSNPHLIHPGQTLTLPGGWSR